jgi:2-amino-4-hydroxy-6-hydroxymethyldihydropteridine diphosphokinase
LEIDGFIAPFAKKLGMAVSWIILGSNLGDRKDNLNRASCSIEERVGSILARSSFYESEPWGFNAPTWFINQVIKLETWLEPLAMLGELKSIEEEMGRKRVPGGYSSRIIDLDILFYENVQIREQSLTIPHPRIQDRAFVLYPLLELDGDLLHPGLNLSVRSLLADCPDRGKVLRLN